MNDVSQVTRTATDLTAIGRLHGNLLTQAVHKANDRLMPGGLAMVELAPVSSHEEWAENVAAAEFRHLTYCHRADHGRCRYAEVDEDDDEPTLQTLRYWTERWRDYDPEREPTVESELTFIRACLNWAWDNEEGWPAFARDIAKARTRLEGILYAGERAERGVPCMYDECRGIRLVRKLEPTRGPDGEKTYEYGNWHCPRCHRQWDNDRYVAMITAAHEETKYEVIDGETWCSPEFAARKVGRPASTVRVWITKKELARLCVVVGRRVGFVRLADIEALDQQALRRNRAA